MRIDFAKAVASGNDFVVVDNRGGRLSDKISGLADLAKVVCRRRHSIGADGLLVLEDSAACDFKMRIFNPDGSEVTMCGNGIRCSALYAQTKGWFRGPVKIETGAGVLHAETAGKEKGSASGEARLSDNTARHGICDSVKIKMTQPCDIKLDMNIGIGKTIIIVHAINTGVAHAVHFVENINGYSVKDIGSKVRHHTSFQPDGTNVDFVETIGESRIAVRTYERGVEDETLACGTGVVASAIISSLAQNIKQPVEALTRSGEVVKVYFKREHNHFTDVYLEGDASIAFEGGLNYV
ncbi:MAG: diaminopimelate epimerase [Candidatus Omnitrophota bacterium]